MSERKVFDIQWERVLQSFIVRVPSKNLVTLFSGRMDTWYLGVRILVDN